ncbi:uncharacterized protein LOC117653202 [Thrips palmi]|uniref:Uncharacterized protein LOC117653202 n=1 Tax=Thrips palmi TaxID=161013 RepID=A0A6P9AB22_THRPL|nr:uncharacterized protein LOC117653202 [Thrips palmi]
MKLCRVGNQTNSPDPIAVNSRVFVGNLNTFQCSKAELERMFQRYGRIAGISMHKGYAFVQFANAFDARSACLGEDKRVVLGQTLDVNLVSEPKAHQTGRKRQNITKTGNDWDYYYDSYYASVGLPTGPPPPQRLPPPPGPPHKRPRLMVPLGSPKHAPPINGHLPMGLAHAGHGHGPHAALVQGPPSPPLNGHHPAAINVFSNPDILICGNCREMYTDLQELLSHKKAHCKLRFACKCHTLPEGKSNHEATLLCSSCRASFSSAWDLMVHVQAAHMLNIYQLGMPADQGDRAARSPTPPSGSGGQSPRQSPPPNLQTTALSALPPGLPALPSALQQQVDQTLLLPAAQLSPQPHQDPHQEQQTATQATTLDHLIDSANASPAPPSPSVPPSPSASSSSEVDELPVPLQDVAVASPTASSSSDQDMAVTSLASLATLTSLATATLQCNLKAVEKDDDDVEALLSASPEPQPESAWEAVTQHV